MKHSRHLCLGLLLGVSGLLAGGTPGVAQEALSPALVTKAKAFKEIDDKYRLTLCNGAKSERDQSKGARDYLQTDLQQQIANDVTSSGFVQKALDTAAAAGDAADKAAAAPNATDQEKSMAAARFQQAKKELHEVAAREKAYLEAELGKNLGVTFAAQDACTDKPNTAAREVEQSKKPAEKRPKQQARTDQRNAPAQAQAKTQGPPASSSPALPSVNLGRGSSTITFGGGGITFGR